MRFLNVNLKSINFRRAVQSFYFLLFQMNLKHWQLINSFILFYFQRNWIETGLRDGTIRKWEKRMDIVRIYLLGIFITISEHLLLCLTTSTRRFSLLKVKRHVEADFENIANENLRSHSATIESLCENKLNLPSFRETEKKRKTTRNQCFNYTEALQKRNKRTFTLKGKPHGVRTWACQTENSESVAQIIYTVNKSRSVCTKHLNFSEKTRLARRVRRAC